jgi:hypothetical protein
MTNPWDDKRKYKTRLEKLADENIVESCRPEDKLDKNICRECEMSNCRKSIKGYWTRYQAAKDYDEMQEQNEFINKFIEVKKVEHRNYSENFRFMKGKK